MYEEKAREVRQAFAIPHPVGQDDVKTPEFYEKIVEQFEFGKRLKHAKQNIMFIVVPHMVHTLPYFLEALTKIGSVVAIIPKESQYVEKVKEFFDVEYRDYIYPEISKKVLNAAASDATAKDNLESRAIVSLFLRKITHKYQDCRFMILDHGGYFAPCLDILIEFRERFAGIVEHTANGHDRYKRWLQVDRPFPIPVFSIAKTTLKGYENDHVATSIISAMRSHIFGASGISQELSRLKIGIIGYGNMGEAIARQLLNVVVDRKQIMVCDTDIEKQSSARRFLSKSSVVHENTPLLEQCQVIIAAASTQILGQVEFNKMKAGACVVCVTSSEDQFTQHPKEWLSKITENPYEYVTTYRRADGTSIHLACDGRSVNFCIGSTPHPILHAVLASVCVAAVDCATQPPVAPFSSICELASPELLLIEKIYEATFDRIEYGVDTFGLQSSSCYFVGRIEEKRKLQDVLSKYRAGDVIIQTIFGLGGLGKSTLASRYAKDALQNRCYNLVARLDATTTKTLYEDFILFAEHLGIANPRERKPRELVEAIYTHLRPNKSLLIIFDNPENYATLNNAIIQDEVVNFLPRHQPHQLAHCIVTTCNQLFQLPDDNSIHLEGLLLEDSAAYIKKRLPAIIEAQARDLANMVNCFPLALCQMAAYLWKNPEVSVQKYIEAYRKIPDVPEDLLRSEVLPGDLHTMTIYKTWDISLQALVLKNPLSVRILKILSYFDAAPIPYAVLDQLAEELGAPGKDLIKEAILQLQTYSLVEFNAKDNSLKFHDLVRRVARLQQLESQKKGESNFCNLEKSFTLAYEYGMALSEPSKFVAHGLSVTKFHDQCLPDQGAREKIFFLAHLGSAQLYKLLFAREAEQTYEFAKRIHDRAALVDVPHVELLIKLANTKAFNNPVQYVAVLDEMFQADWLGMADIMHTLQSHGVSIDLAKAKQQIMQLPVKTTFGIVSAGIVLNFSMPQIAALEPRQFFEVFISSKELKQFWLPNAHHVLYIFGIHDVAIAYLIFKKNLSQAEDMARQYVRDTDGQDSDKRVQSLCLLVEALIFQNKLVLADGICYLEEAYTIIQRGAANPFFAEQVLYILSVLYATAGRFDESYKLSFDLLEAVIARYGEDGVKQRIDSLLTINAPFEEDSKSRAGSALHPNTTRFELILAQTYRIAGRLLCALNNHDNAKKFFERSLVHDPNSLLAKYEYSLLLARVATTRPRAIPLLEHVAANSGNLQSYFFYKREARTLPKFMLPLATTHAQALSLYFLASALLAWVAYKDRNFVAFRTQAERLYSEIRIRPRLSSPLIFSKLQAKSTKQEGKVGQLVEAINIMSGKSIRFGKTSFTFRPEGNICIETSEEASITRGTENKFIFTNKSGEAVVEVSGAASEDGRQDRSWAFVYVQKNGYSDPHFHRDRTEVYYIVHGIAKVIIDGRAEELHPGQEITINPGEQHALYSMDPNNILALMVKCTPSWSPADFNLVLAASTQDDAAYRTLKL